MYVGTAYTYIERLVSVILHLFCRKHLQTAIGIVRLDLYVWIISGLYIHAQRIL